MKKFTLILIGFLLLTLPRFLFSQSLNCEIQISGIATDSVNMCIGDDQVFSFVPSGGTLPYTYLWSGYAPNTISGNTLANPTITATTPGTYMLTCTTTDALSNTCTDSMVIYIAPLPNLFTSANSTICFGECATLTAFTTTGDGIIWYEGFIGGPIDTSCANCTSLDITVCPATTTDYYAAVIIDSTGCIRTKKVTVTVSPPLIVNAGNNQTIPNGSCTTLNASGGVSYVWSPAAGLSNPSIANPVACPNVSTMYTVTVTSSDGCTATASTYVSIICNLTATATASPAAICPGECSTISIVASGDSPPYTYIWSTGSMGPNFVTCPASTCTYTATVTSGSGCTTLASATIYVGGVFPSVQANPSFVCTGDSSLITASGGTHYSWSTGDTTTTLYVHPSVTTTYTVTISNNCGGTGTASVTVNFTTGAPVADAGADVTICQGSFTTLHATGGNTFQWSPSTGLNNPNISSPTAYPTSTTVYYVTVTTGCGSASDSVIVTVVPSTLSANAGSDFTIPCYGVCDTLGGSPTAPGGITPYTYLWSSNPVGWTSTLANPIVCPYVNSTYVVTVHDNIGCSATDNVVVTINSFNPTATATPPSICTGDSTVLNATGGTSYAWSSSPNDPTLSGQQNLQSPIVYPTVNTNYVVTVTSSYGCTSSADVYVSLNSLNAYAYASPTTICSGASSTLHASGGSHYHWNTGDTINVVTVSPTTTTTYTVTVLNNCGNSATRTVTVNVQILPIAEAGVNDTLCTGGSIQLIASGGTSYHWSPGTGLSNTNIYNPVASPTVTTTYIVTVSNTCGSATDNVTVVISTPTIFVDAGIDDTICHGANITLNGSTSGISPQWNPGTGLSSTTILNPIAYPIITTTYTLSAMDTVVGCIVSDHVIITVLPLPFVNLGSNVSVCTGDSVQLNAPAGNASYAWSPGTGLSAVNIRNPYAFPTINTQYWVTVTSYNGCTAKDDIYVTVINNTPVNAYAGPNVSICSGTSATLYATGGTVFAWSPSTGLNSTSGNIVSAHPSATTTYIVTVTNACGNTATDDVTVSVYTCSDTIKGKVFLDSNLNGILDNGEPPFGNVYVKETPSNQYTWINSNTPDGKYVIKTTTGSHTVMLQNVPQYYTAVPATHTAVFTLPGQVDSLNDFAIQLTSNVNDLQIWIWTSTPPRPGFMSTIYIRYRNVGTNIANGYVQFDFDNNYSFMNSSPMYDTYSGNTITWNFTNLLPGSYGNMINTTFLLPSSVAVGTNLQSIAKVYPITGDVTPANNTAILNEIVVASCDPNNKIIDPTTPLLVEDIENGLPLIYTVRFQNTGNFTAENIMIVDTLDPFLDPQSLEVLEASHPYDFLLCDQNILRFTFDSIMLPDSASDELLSHGYVRYSAKPMATITPADTIENTAFIFFDYNDPVVTNTVYTIFRDTTTEINEILFNDQVKIFPNPFNNTFDLEILNNMEFPGQLKIFNSLADVVMKKEISQPVTTINAVKLKSGIYFIVVEDRNGNVVGKGKIVSSQ
jgi:uncharacterized repeat protein (TIGR01451 family)